jgi:hypothetical protein
MLRICRITIAPRPSGPTTWNKFLPISMPITAIVPLSMYDVAVLLDFAAPSQLRLLAALEHGRTIPPADEAHLPRLTNAREPLRPMPEKRAPR